MALFSPFGGENIIKGINLTNQDHVILFVRLFVWLTSNGYDVIVIPNGRPWGNRKIVQKLVEIIPDPYRMNIQVAPDPQEYPRLHKYFIEWADQHVVIEGGLLHLTYNMGRPYFYMLMPGSGLNKWLPPGPGPHQKFHDNLRGTILPLAITALMQAQPPAEELKPEDELMLSEGKIFEKLQSLKGQIQPEEYLRVSDLPVLAGKGPKVIDPSSDQSMLSEKQTIYQEVSSTLADQPYVQLEEDPLPTSMALNERDGRIYIHFHLLNRNKENRGDNGGLVYIARVPTPKEIKNLTLPEIAARIKLDRGSLMAESDIDKAQLVLLDDYRFIPLSRIKPKNQKWQGQIDELMRQLRILFAQNIKKIQKGQKQSPQLKLKYDGEWYAMLEDLGKRIEEEGMKAVIADRQYNWKELDWTEPDEVLEALRSSRDIFDSSGKIMSKKEAIQLFKELDQEEQYRSVYVNDKGDVLFDQAMLGERKEERFQALRKEIREEIIKSMNEVIGKLLAEIDKLEAAPQRKAIKRKLETYWWLVAQALLNKSYVTDEGIRPLVKRILATDFQDAKNNAVRALSQIDPKAGANVAKVMLSAEIKEERDLLQNFVDLLLDPNSHVREGASEDVERLLPLAGRWRTFYELGEGDKKDVERLKELKEVAEMALESLVRARDPEAVPEIRRLLRSGRLTDEDKGADFAYRSRFPALVPDLKRAFEHIEFRLGEAIMGITYDLKEPQEWNPGNPIFAMRKTQIKLAKAVVQLGVQEDKKWALERLKGLLEFYLNLNKKFDGSYDPEFRFLLLEAADALIELKEGDYVRDPLQAFYAELNQQAQHLYDKDGAYVLQRMDNAFYRNIQFQHRIVERFIQLEDKQARPLTEELWKKALPLISQGKTQQQSWLALMIVESAVHMALSLPLPKAADDLRGLWNQESFISFLRSMDPMAENRLKEKIKELEDPEYFSNYKEELNRLREELKQIEIKGGNANGRIHAAEDLIRTFRLQPEDQAMLGEESEKRNVVRQINALKEHFDNMVVQTKKVIAKLAEAGDDFEHLNYFVILRRLQFSSQALSLPPHKNLKMRSHLYSEEKEYSLKIASQGGDFRKFEIITQKGGLQDHETYLDEALVQKIIFQSGLPLEFGEGLLYHGLPDLDSVLRVGFVPEGMAFTRMGAQYAIAYFKKNRESPAILVLKSQTFNRYARLGKARIEMASKKIGQIAQGDDLYPTINDRVPLEDIEEMWISEETYRRYEAIMAGRISLDSEAALKPVLESLMAQKKIRVIPGLHHKELDYDNFFESAMRQVGAYIRERNLVKEIPTLAIYPGEPSPVELIQGKTMVSSGHTYEFRWKSPEQGYLSRYQSINGEMSLLLDENQRILKMNSDDGETIYDYNDPHYKLVLHLTNPDGSEEPPAQLFPRDPLRTRDQPKVAYAMIKDNFEKLLKKILEEQGVLLSPSKKKRNPLSTMTALLIKIRGRSYSEDDIREAFQKAGNSFPNKEKLRAMVGQLNDALKQGPQEESDNLMLGEEMNTPGGIDLNPQHLDLQMQGNPLPLEGHFDGAPWEALPIEGFVPVIIEIVPISNFPLLLGVSDEKEEPQLSRLPS